MRASVDAYLERHPDEVAAWHDFAVVEADASGPRTAHVRLVARVYPSSVGWALAAWSDGIDLRAEASADAT